MVEVDTQNSIDDKITVNALYATNDIGSLQLLQKRERSKHLNHQEGHNASGPLWTEKRMRSKAERVCLSMMEERLKDGNQKRMDAIENFEKLFAHVQNFCVYCLAHLQESEQHSLCEYPKSSRRAEKEIQDSWKTDDTSAALVLITIRLQRLLML